jgi:predicted nucleotidyltransferase
MTNVNTPVTLRDIRKIVQQIVEGFAPQQVILFGSYAHGKPTADSDVDLLVVMDTEQPPLHVAAHIADAIEHPFAVDILVRKPSELEASLARRGSFATEVMTTGVVLYDARDT